MRAALPALFEALDAMRQADVSGTHGYGVWDGAGNAPDATWREALLALTRDWEGSRIAGWRPRLEESPTGAHAFDQSAAWLASAVDELHDERHLIHADLLNYNVLLAGQRVSAVLDWGSAMYGDWLFDVAWFSFWQPWYPQWTGIDFAVEARDYFAARDVPLTGFEHRLRCCEVAIGLDNQAYCAFKGVERWPQLEAVARRTLACSGAMP
jgi:hygromycin-B 4-O-kinase